jgi:predicted nucleic acid-binding protein
VILVDTSVWVDHLRAGERDLIRLLEERQVLGHPFVLGELALGNLRQRALVLREFAQLPQAEAATDMEVLHFVEEQALYGRGIGYVDVHLLASLRLSPGALLWTRDARLHTVAGELDLAAPLK